MTLLRELGAPDQHVKPSVLLISVTNSYSRAQESHTDRQVTLRIGLRVASRFSVMRTVLFHVPNCQMPHIWKENEISY